MSMIEVFLVCGTGAGMAIVANKYSGVRAVSVNDAYTAERAIASNNAQVITFGALITGEPNAKMYTDIWLSNMIFNLKDLDIKLLRLTLLINNYL